MIAIVKAWDPARPQRWTFTITGPRTIRHRYWDGKQWGAAFNLHPSLVDLAPGTNLVPDYTAPDRWDIWAATADGRLAHWWWNKDRDGPGKGGDVHEIL